MESPLCEFKSFANEIDNYLKKLSKKYDVEHLSGPQGRTVVYLYRNADKEVFAKDIMEHLKLSKSVVSNLLTRMEKNNFILIKCSENDRRYKTIELTKLGIEKAEVISNFFNEMSNELFQNISREELKITYEVIHKINENLQRNN